MESARRRRCRAAGCALRLLGPLALSRDGVPLALPQSRKVRALIAYLALAPPRGAQPPVRAAVGPAERPAR